MKIAQYTYKNETYEVDTNLKMKHPTTRKWVDAVSYYNVKNTQQKFVREKKEFMLRFKLHEK